MSILTGIKDALVETFTEEVAQTQVCAELYGCAPNDVVSLAVELGHLYGAQSRIVMDEHAITIILTCEDGILPSDFNRDLSLLLA